MSDGHAARHVTAAPSARLVPDVPGPPREPAPPAGTTARPHGIGVSFLVPLGVVFLLLYGSVLPLHIDWPAFYVGNLFGLASIGATAGTLEDVIVNLLVYAPLGFTLALWANPIAVRPARVWSIAAAGALGTSVIAETLQTGIAQRVASWNDVLLNVSGAGLGALIAAGTIEYAPSALRRFRAACRVRPFATVSAALTVGLLLFELAPFDFITSTAGLHAAFHRAEWSAPAYGGIADALRTAADAMYGTLWFCALGAALALDARAAGRLPARAAAFAMKNGILLAVLIEFLQLLTASHVFEVYALALRAAAVAAGAWAAAFILRFPDRSVEERFDLGRLVSDRCLLILLAVQLLLLVLSGVALPTGNVYGTSTLWPPVPPFEALWQARFNRAAVHCLSVFAVYAALSCTAAALLLRRHPQRSTTLICIAVPAAATSIAVLEAATSRSPLDLTDAALAVLAASAVTTAINSRHRTAN